MKRFPLVGTFVALVVAAAVVPAASRAQWFPVPIMVPPPASVCATPVGTCGIVTPTPIGSACICYWPMGWATGVAR